MPDHPAPRSPFSLLAPPYAKLTPIEGPLQQVFSGRVPPYGASLVWHAHRGDPARDWRSAFHRPGGMALLTVLPRAPELEKTPEILELVVRCQPLGLLPFDRHLTAPDLTAVLRRPPPRVSIAVTEYLAWRGVDLDGDTRHLVHRTIELGRELRTVSALSRALYLSRRALGRRFSSRGLPVPSHWLHFARILHASLSLQNEGGSLFSVACDLGYPDGFSLSNQMKRLTGVRPTTVRHCFGWQWLVECWLEQEQSNGNLRVPRRSTWASGRTTEASRIRPSTPPPQWPSSSSARFVADSGTTSRKTSTASDAEPKR